MTLVRMIRRWRLWNPGETAGFDPALAGDLVRCGVAEVVAPQPAEAPEPEAPKQGRRR